MMVRKSAKRPKGFGYEVVTPKGTVVAWFRGKKAARLAETHWLPYQYTVKKVRKRKR
jgi:hypothetical protein